MVVSGHAWKIFWWVCRGVYNALDGPLLGDKECEGNVMWFKRASEGEIKGTHPTPDFVIALGKYYGKVLMLGCWNANCD
jgi:hypothetical protein